MEDIRPICKAQISDCNKAIELNPRDAQLYFSRGSAHCGLDQYDKAIADYTKAIELNPKLGGAYLCRGAVYHDKGQYDKANSDYTKAIEIDPELHWAYNYKALLLATCLDASYRDGSKAVELAKKAVELSPEAWNLATLAAAYAEVGKFEDAIATQEKAIDLIEKKGEIWLGMDINSNIDPYIEHLKLYKANKPRR
jgi:tetratricopeptide (TPR) repeat protein